MKMLYLDNFRGFSNTYIPIKDVNFLVGENSTGKTSVIGLLKLISSPSFWYEYNFNNPEVNFGHFEDIVSITAEDRTYFSVGYIEEVESNQKGTCSINAFLMTFVEKDGIPAPALYAYNFSNSAIKIQIKPAQTRYKRQTVGEFQNTDLFIEKVFSQWSSSFKKEKTGFKLIPQGLRAFSDAPPVFIASALEDITEEKHFKSKSIRARVPTIGRDIAWLAPIRTKPRKTYDEYKLEFSPEGVHTPYLIKKILDKKKDAEEFKKYLKKIGKASGLFDDIQIKKYGKGATAPFELDILLNKDALSISNVGYGVSQALPVIVEMFIRSNGTSFAIQQPEVHLHPKAQAALGDALFELAKFESKKFIIETHSDYTIDRFRMNFRRKNKKKFPEAQILFFERDAKGNSVYPIPILNDGELPDDQPKGYRKFFLKEEMDILGL